MPTYEIEFGDTGFHVTKKRRDEVNSKTFYSHHYFDTWAALITWLTAEVKQ